MRVQQHPSRRSNVSKTRDIFGQESIESKKNFRGKVDFLKIEAFYKGKHTLDLSYGLLFTKRKPSPDRSFYFQKILSAQDLHIQEQLSVWRGVVGPSFRQVRTPCWAWVGVGGPKNFVEKLSCRLLVCLSGLLPLQSLLLQPQLNQLCNHLHILYCEIYNDLFLCSSY